MTHAGEAQDSAFHVLLEGARVGPYNRRTIVGMRIRNTLTSEHVLIGNDGVQLTVADLIGRPPAEDFSANRSGVFSLVRATFAAALIDAGRGPHAIPAFRGEIETRVQSDVLRLSGRFRRGFRWKEDRVKIALRDVVHARIRGSLVDLWLRGKGTSLQRIVLELFTPVAAGDLVESLPEASPYPQHAAGARPGTAASGHSLWIAIGSVALVMGTVLVVLLWPRVH